ncbi:GvpL/GvpF family gas vesicle protein [Gracilibacillus dipsosauri]|uniref:GvpL/GvpF family gas vesicle protein n=1 Tax=Gracilibacillus dipsosauri TaxID=178340 RepID=UPI002409F3E6
MEPFIYLYAFIPEEEVESKPLANMEGFDRQNNIYTVTIDGIKAVVCRLHSEEYSEEVIQEKIENDMEWLQQKAYHHHQTLMKLYEEYTLIPLKFCTIYQNEESLRQKVEEKLDDMREILTQLKEKEEWNLKIYCNEESLKKIVSQDNPTIAAKKEEINQLPPGRQFFERKKIDQLIMDELDLEKDRICEVAHEQLNQYAEDAVIKKNWSKEMTGRKENMAWNSVFLLKKDQVEPCLEELEQAEKELETKGFTLEITGPWPAYHFASF